MVVCCAFVYNKVQYTQMYLMGGREYLVVLSNRILTVALDAELHFIYTFIAQVWVVFRCEYCADFITRVYSNKIIFCYCLH